MSTSTQRNNIRKPSRNRRQRLGAAIVELALCLPIFFLIVMATVETCSMIYLRQSAKIAAYECARLGILPEMTKETLQDQCDVILQGRRIEGYTFTCVPDDPSTLGYEDLLTTTVTIPSSEASLVGSWFYAGDDITESVTIMAEY